MSAWNEARQDVQFTARLDAVWLDMVSR